MNTAVIFIDNFDSFTYNLVDELRILGCQVTVWRNDVDVEVIAAQLEARRNSGQKPLIVLSPGPSRPEDAHNLLPLVRANLGRYPQLGICLGHQALGMALGGQVVAAPEILHGKSSLINHDGSACFHNLPSPLKVARYHSLVVNNLPASVKVPAWLGDICMALYEPEARALGLQFHPESIMSTYGRELLHNALKLLTA